MAEPDIDTRKSSHLGKAPPPSTSALAPTEPTDATEPYPSPAPGMVALGDPIYLLAAIRDAIIRHAIAHLPNESCGLLGDDGSSTVITRMHPVAVARPHPRRFTMEPHAQLAAHLAIEANGGRWRAIWHSHPTSEAYPSAIDKHESLNWPGIVAVIISLATTEPVIRAFTIHAGDQAEERPIQWVTEPLP